MIYWVKKVCPSWSIESAFRCYLPDAVFNDFNLKFVVELNAMVMPVDRKEIVEDMLFVKLIISSVVDYCWSSWKTLSSIANCEIIFFKEHFIFGRKVFVSQCMLLYCGSNE